MAIELAGTLPYHRKRKCVDMEGKIRMQNRAWLGRRTPRESKERTAGPDTGHRPLGGNEETGDERKAAREATDASRELLLSSAAIRARWILQPFHSPVTTDHQTGFSWNSMAGRGRRRHPGRFLLLDHETSLSDPSLYDDRSIDAC